MRIYILMITVLFLQHATGQDFKAGIRFGGVGSQVNGDGLEGFDKAGILFGATLKRNFSEKFSGQFEMLFIQKGSRQPINDYNQYYLMRLGYIEVPVLVTYNINNKIGIYSGLSFGVLISNEESTEMGVIVDPPPFKKFELAYAGGLVYALSDNWSFDLRYSHSITTIRPYVAGYTTFFDKGQYNVLIQFALNYEF